MPRKTRAQRAQMSGKTSSQQKQADQKKGLPKKKVDPLQKKIGAQGTNPLMASHHRTSVNNSNLVVSTEDPTLDVGVFLFDRSIAYLATGIVLRAMKKGWFGQALGASNDISPYFAFRYLIDVFNSSLKGTIPAIQTAPRWFWELLHAMRPKTENFKTGKVSYRPYILETGEGDGVAFSLGNADEEYTLFWGRPSTATAINGFNTLVDPGAYNFDQNGSPSAQSMFAFFNSQGLSIRCADPGEKAFWEHDTSFFSMVYPEYGSSFFCPAGLANTVYSERQIRSPILAKFASYQPDDFGWRASHQYRKSAGSPCYVGPRLSELTKASEMYNKASPIFKFYNLDEFIDRLAMTLVLALETQFNIVGGQQITPTFCPLTFQEFCILVRQALLPRFCNEMAQDLRTSASTGGLVSLLPLIVGPNGISQTTVGEQPLFPKFFAESVRATSRVEIKLRDSINDKLILDVLPVLVRPKNYVLPTNYAYTVGENSFNIFRTSEVPEAAINLIDASTVSGSDTYYLNLNGTQMETLITEWNAWIKTLSCLTGLTVVGTEEGITALNTNTYTLIERTIVPELPQVVTTTTTTMTKQKSTAKMGPKILGTPLRKVAAIGGGPTGNDYFRDVACQAVTSNSPVLSTLFKYLSKMTLPLSWANADVLDAGQMFYQGNQIEPYTVTLTNSYIPFLLNGTTSVGYPTLYDKHVASAALDVRPFANNQKSEMEVELDELAAQGRGGFLTSIAAALGNAIGGERIGRVIQTIGDSVGI